MGEVAGAGALEEGLPPCCTSLAACLCGGPPACLGVETPSRDVGSVDCSSPPCDGGTASCSVESGCPPPSSRCGLSGALVEGVPGAGRSVPSSVCMESGMLSVSGTGSSRGDVSTYIGVLPLFVAVPIFWRWRPLVAEVDVCRVISDQAFEIDVAWAIWPDMAKMEEVLLARCC